MRKIEPLQISITALLVLLIFQLLNASILKRGEPFRPFSLISVDNEIISVNLKEGKLTVQIESLTNGQTKVIHPDAVLIDFWATWCVPCRAAMPYMQGLLDRNKTPQDTNTGGLIVLGIALDQSGSKIVKPFYKKLAYTYPMLADPTKEKGDGLIHTVPEMKSQYKVQVLPVVYLIDSKGIIQHAHSGFEKKDFETIEQAYQKIAKGNSP
jgi:thiol-disulfide isomerase/thioredoxin